MKLKVMILPFVLASCVTSLSAETLKSVVGEVLETNPVVRERLKNYNATREEVDIAAAGYYPTLDMEVGTGRKYTGRIRGKSTKESLSVFQSALILRQNLFNGFSTKERVKYQQMRTLAAAYSYLEKANDVTLQTIKVYLDLFLQQELIENSRTNVRHNELLYEKVKKAYKAGLTTLSEVTKIQSSLSLAKSNMMVQQNRLSNAMFNFRRVTGRLVSLKNLKKADFDLKLPANLQKATMYALEYNPSLLVGKYNIKSAEALYRESKSAFLPKVDVEIAGNYNDNFNALSYPEDRIQGMVVVSYNLFNGGADEATKRNRLSRLSQEVDVTNDLKRQVVEGMDLSWSAYELALDQIPFLKNYKKQSEETLELYAKEYDMGERSLLDLLASENDLKQAKDELANARYSLLLSKYRILDAMGLTMASVMGDVTRYYRKVGVYTKGKRPAGDTLPISYDHDGDGVVSNKDVCAGSKKKNAVYPSGCKKKFKF